MRSPESSLHTLLATVSQFVQLSPATSNRLECSHSPSAALQVPLSQVLKAPSTVPRHGASRLSPALARQLSTACLQAAQELRDACEASLRNAVEKGTATAADSLEDEQAMDGWMAAHAQQARAWADDAFACAPAHSATAKSATAGHKTSTKKPVFNHEYTPLLEKYFEYNAYPSAVDRAVLARKSMMTPRQIEVWFQNHRNRARKDGKALRKLTEDPLPLELSLKSLERKMPFFTIPERERQSVKKPEPFSDDSSDEEGLASIPTHIPDRSCDVLNPLRPRHAYPTLYPPSCDYDPFPCKTGSFKFPSPEWFRTPATHCRIIKPAIDVDGLVADFGMKLHLRAPARKRQRSNPVQAWCTSRATVVPSAPHPALVRPPKVFPPMRVPSLSTDASPSSCSRPLQSPDSCSQLAMPTTPQHPNSTPLRRQVARLPKRTQKGTCIAHGHGSPQTSGPSSSRSSSVASRSTSFGSDMSTDRRPSSSSSCSSSPSSALATPELSYATLPDDVCSSSVSVSGVDFDNMEEAFGGNKQSPSPAVATPFSFSVATQAKNPFTFGFDVPLPRRSESRNSP